MLARQGWVFLILMDGSFNPPMPAVSLSLSTCLGKIEWGLQWPHKALWLQGGMIGSLGPSPEQTSQGQWAHALASGHADPFLQRGQCRGRKGWNPATSQALRIPALPLSLLTLVLLVWATAMPTGKAGGGGWEWSEKPVCWYAWPGTGSVSPARPSSAGCRHLLRSPSPPACPSGLLRRHHYCPQPALPVRPKGGVTHGAATSPRLAHGV